MATLATHDLQQLLDKNADDFLIVTDRTYQDCSHGIQTLDRIIVSVNSALADEARGYLLPIIYAYWERFFRVVFAEYLLSIDRLKIPASHAREELALARLRRELKAFLKRENYHSIDDFAAPRCCSHALRHTKEFREFFLAPLSFSDPLSYVKAHSNVNNEVLRENCHRLGIDVKEIESAVSPAKLYERLKCLVSERHKIAHGENFKAVTQEVWAEHKDFALNLMHCIQFVLYGQLRTPAKLFRTLPLS
jgi:hypothetical protein